MNQGYNHFVGQHGQSFYCSFKYESKEQRNCAHISNNYCRDIRYLHNTFVLK
jgi:hypothetical protein